MKSHKIALLIDSCTDVPDRYVKDYNMYVLPLMINYSDGEYRDRVDISPQEVYDRFSVEVPKTSTPTVSSVKELFERVIADGYEEVLAVTISSGLSSTWELVSSVTKDFPSLKTYVLDTKNIAIGAGFSAIRAGQLIEEGKSLEEIKEILIKTIANTKIYFCVETLEYLYKGGRIGLVTSVLGTTLSLKPIISCNENGIYYTVTKTIGRRKSLTKTMKLAVDYANQGGGYNIAIAHGNAQAEADEIGRQIQLLLPNANIIIEGQISPALVVHTGPGLVGVGIQRIF